MARRLSGCGTCSSDTKAVSRKAREGVHVRCNISAVFVHGWCVDSFVHNIATM